MSNHQDPARERLLDASLSEVLGRPAVLSPELELSLPAGPSPTKNNGWLAAALVLLGSAVVIGSWASSRPDEQVAAGTGYGPVQDDPVQDDPVQDDQGRGKPFPKLWPLNPSFSFPELPLTVCKTIEELEQLPGDIVNLSVELSSLKDLERLARFSSLCRLHLRGNGPDTFWAGVGDEAGVLDPLQKLQSLQILWLPSNIVLAPSHVRALRPIRSLRSLSIGSSKRLTAEVARELVALPSLRQLTVHGALLPASFLAELQAGQLEALELLACPNLDVPEFAAIAKIKSLQSLAVMMAGKGRSTIEGKRYELFELGEDAFKAFRALPKLVALDLDESQFDDKFMAELPKQLRYLRLGDYRMTPATIADLKRLQGLEELRFHHATKYADLVGLLESLRLKRLWLRGWLNDDVVRALARHKTLESATLRIHGARDDHGAKDLSLLTTAPRLRSLTLRYGRQYDVANLPPAAVMKAFKDRGIDVTLQPF